MSVPERYSTRLFSLLPAELVALLRQMDNEFICLAAQLHTTYEQLKVLKARYLRNIRALSGDTRNPFAEVEASSLKLRQLDGIMDNGVPGLRKPTSKTPYGPSPFTSLSISPMFPLTALGTQPNPSTVIPQATSLSFLTPSTLPSSSVGLGFGLGTSVTKSREFHNKLCLLHRLPSCRFHPFARTLKLCGRDIPSSIIPPPYVLNQKATVPNVPIIHSFESIEQLRHAGSIVHQLFEELRQFLKPGLTTQDVDNFIFAACIAKHVYPSPLGYCGFPKSVCTSVNEVACHGIPSVEQSLRAGDLLSVDISIFTGTVHGDACRSYVLSDASDQVDVLHSDPSKYDPETDSARFLCAVAENCCAAGTRICSPGTPYAEIATSICKVADLYGCSVVPGIRGHGLADFLHGPPEIIHSVNELQSTDTGTLGYMKSGHVFTIEPCLALSKSTGGRRNRYCLSPVHPVVLDDGWTVVTLNRSLTAQFENTVLITDSGHDVLT
ncbi:putative methionine aminopeptidase, type I [Opisthorchis viverrini]|uniref:Putative methionine aminopeptidase, type I n=1 Tax=Opisthorchis viverrini TaxID=6198 RepID=A0A1S8WHE1_OPIVI|nr:putative methionine aminopeptidase, type I [Opisthorchis viverrini]